MKKNSEDFGEFRKIFRNMWGIISENWKLYASIHHIWSANVGTHEFSNRKNKAYSKNINEILKNYFENFQKKIWKISRPIEENFVKYFGKFWELNRGISIIISKTFEKYFGKFQKTSVNIFGSVEIYYQNFWELFWKFSNKSSEYFESYCGGFR